MIKKQRAYQTRHEQHSPNFGKKHIPHSMYTQIGEGTFSFMKPNKAGKSTAKNIIDENYDRHKRSNMQHPSLPSFVKQTSTEMKKRNDFNTHIVFGSQKKIKKTTQMNIGELKNS